MAADFTRLVDDLGYAKTFYPTSKVTQLINQLATRIYLSIYRNRKEESNRISKFWKYDVPLTVQKHHKVILFAFVLFALFFAVGFYSSATDQKFVREILGDAYVNETEKNIAEGNPFGIYQSGEPLFMWIWIMIHNIMVGFTYFFRGILFGIPSISAMLEFGVMVGAFDQMFAAKGLGQQFILSVMIHGTLEIPAAILSSAAGIVMGKSILFPGTLKRLQAFAIGVKDGLKIMIGVVPVFMVAAFFEGFVTRHYKMHAAFSLTILLSSAAFIIWYFIVYPIRLRKKLVAKEQDSASIYE